MFCWHDWARFREPDQSNVIRKSGNRFISRHYYKGVEVGVSDDINKVSDLVCYKCKGKQLNLAKILNRKLSRKRKEVAVKQRTKDIKQAKQDAIQAARIQLRNEESTQ